MSERVERCGMSSRIVKSTGRWLLYTLSKWGPKTSMFSLLVVAVLPFAIFIAIVTFFMMASGTTSENADIFPGNARVGVHIVYF